MGKQRWWDQRRSRVVIVVIVAALVGLAFALWPVGFQNTETRAELAITIIAGMGAAVGTLQGIIKWVRGEPASQTQPDRPESANVPPPNVSADSHDRWRNRRRVGVIVVGATIAALSVGALIGSGGVGKINAIGVPTPSVVVTNTPTSTPTLSPSSTHKIAPSTPPPHTYTAVPPPPEIVVPRVTGESLSSAEHILAAYDLAFRVKPDPTSTRPVGTVDHTSPSNGTSVKPNSTITIYVSGSDVPSPSS